MAGIRLAAPVSASQAAPTRKRRRPLSERPQVTGRPSPEVCPPGKRWPWCAACKAFAASIGHDRQSGHDFAAYIRPEHAQALGWTEVKFVCPGCGRKPLANRVVHAEGDVT